MGAERSARSRFAVAAASPALVSLLLALAACDWVDSTGRQAGDGASDVSPLVLDDALSPSVADAGVDGVVALTEPVAGSETPRLTVRRSDANVAEAEGERLGWTAESLAEGPLAGCAAVEDFRTGIAASTLAEACSAASSESGDCALAIEREEGSGAEDEIVFSVRVPILRAPVGVRRALELERADGSLSRRVYDFCLVSINEAPVARDDAYVLVEGETLVVAGGAANSLLANDEDDEDAGNLPLRVDPTPVTPPAAASAFTLGTDGGFSYTFAASGIRADVVDSFVYRVGDGSHAVEATATLRIVAGNLPPALLVDAVPPLLATVDELLEVDLADYFVDPEGETLALTLGAGDLPRSGAFALDDVGRLVGVAADADVGDYNFVVLASDGERALAVPVTLSVVAAPNRAPRYVEGSIEDIVLRRGARVTGLGAEFVDPDGDPLVFELIGVPPAGLSFDPDEGTFSGRPRARGVAADLAIRAVDPDGAAALSDPFSIAVR